MAASKSLNFIVALALEIKLFVQDIFYKIIYFYKSPGNDLMIRRPTAHSSVSITLSNEEAQFAP